MRVTVKSFPHYADYISHQTQAVFPVLILIFMTRQIDSSLVFTQDLRLIFKIP